MTFEERPQRLVSYETYDQSEMRRRDWTKTKRNLGVCDPVVKNILRTTIPTITVTPQ